MARRPIRPVDPPIKFLVLASQEMQKTLVLSVFIFAASMPAAAQHGSELTVDAITHGAFTGARMPEPQWLADGSAYLDLRPAGAAGGPSEIVRVNAATGATSIVASAQALRVS